MNIPPLDETGLRALIQQPETDNLEFKAKVLSNSQIADYVVGIGNAGGGFLIFGITDKPPRQIVGVDELNVDALQKVRRSIYDATQVRVELETLTVTQKFVLAIRIPPRQPGTVLHTSDGRFLIRVGSDLLGLTPSQIGSMLRESNDEVGHADFSISLRFPGMQHSGHYSVFVKNDSNEKIQPKQVWLEKDGLKLGDIVTKDWAAIEARSAGELSWQPNRNPLDTLIAKWQAAEKKLVPGHNVMEEIDVIVIFVAAGPRRRQHRERLMILVDWINRTMLQWV